MRSKRTHPQRPRLGEAVTLRPAEPQDRDALERLAGLDSARVLSGEILLALVDGEPRAALALADGRTVADPFRLTAHLVELLRLRQAQLRPAGGGRRGLAIAARRAGRALWAPRPRAVGHTG